MRIDKLLGSLGLGTRSELKKDIKGSGVIVNGELVKNPGKIVDPDCDEISFKGKTVKFQEYFYILLNKPKDCVSAVHDNVFPTVIDIVKEDYPIKDLFPMGRLDKDTEGLLVITNDGKLSHELLSPKKHVPKTYYVELDGRISPEKVRQVEEGVTFSDGYKTKESSFKLLNDGGEFSRGEIIITEGKFHQVKRMFEAVGLKVRYLKRIKMGNLELDPDLGLGEYRELSEEELKRLKGE